MGEIISTIVYGILSIPVFLGVLWWIFNLIFSPFIVASNIFNEFLPSVVGKIEKVETSKTAEKIQYDPKYVIEDPFKFSDIDISQLEVGDVIFIEE